MTSEADSPAVGDTLKGAADVANERRLRDAARLMGRNILASYAVLGVSSSFMLTVAVEMVFSCLMDIAQRDRSAAEAAVNAMASDLVSVMDQLQSWEQNEAGSNGTQAS